MKTWTLFILLMWEPVPGESGQEHELLKFVDISSQAICKNLGRRLSHHYRADGVAVSMPECIGPFPPAQTQEDGWND